MALVSRLSIIGKHEAYPWPRPRSIFGDDPVPAWLNRRIIHLDASGAFRYEASMGGPHNGLLNSYFPANRRFLVKPIPRLRQAVTPADPALPGERISTDSYNRCVHIRKDDGAPDFIVCKAAESGALNGDKALLMWELKRRKDGDGAPVEMFRYERWAHTYQALRVTPGEFHVALCERNEMTIYILTPGNNFIEICYGHVLSKTVHDILERIAVQNP